MPRFDVSCFNSTSGKFLWSVSQEAPSALEAIAQTCLAPESRPAFHAEHGMAGWPDDGPVEMPHPIGGKWATVRAELA